MQNDVRHELGTNFIEYAVAVNTDRAIPDAKSGLKPVAKRILWSAFEEGRLFSKPHVKAARIVGDVMGKYHPHGDSSIYGAMVRLSQPWIMRYPLIDWHGNNGNIAGDGPAAARYTEARLTKLAEDGMLKGIKKNNVDFIDNYSEDALEPVTLPDIFPNLLCNPNTGIGVAIACNWLPHNLCEVGAAIDDYLDGKEPHIKGPDFPTGGLIINMNDMPSIEKTGHGSIKLRARYKLEKNNIVFYEVPYGQTIESLMDEIGAVCDAKEIEEISRIRDESNKNGIRIVIECSKGTNPDAIAMKLYAKTKLQVSISYNQVALVNKTPVELNLKDAIKIYVEHNIDCIKREFAFDLNKAKARLNIVEGLLIALEDINNVIQLIKTSNDSNDAKQKLIAKYNLNEEQAKAILAMRLSSLAHMEKMELENEKKELVNKIADIEDILAKEERQVQILRDRLHEIVKKYGDARRTELAQIEIPKEEKEIETIIPEDVVVVISKTGLIKKIPTKSFTVQKRKGKGAKSENDAVLETISTNTIDTLMVFTNKGKMYRLVVDNVPDGLNTTPGVPINSILTFENDEKVIAITSLYRKTNAEYVVFITKQGLIKKTLISEYMNTKKKTGIAAIKLKEGDSIANVTFLKDEELVLITKNGMSIRFETAGIAPIGRVAAGVKGIKLDANDEVVCGLPIHKKSDLVAIVAENGYGKKVKLDEFPIQGRGGKGVTVYKGSPIAGAAMVSDEDNLLIIGRNSSICISTTDMPILSRTGLGNLMIKNGNVTRITKL